MILGSVAMAIAAVSIMMFPQIRLVLYSIPALTIVIVFPVQVSDNNAAIQN